MQWTNFDEFVDRRILYSNAIQCGWRKKNIHCTKAKWNIRIQNGIHLLDFHSELERQALMRASCTERESLSAFSMYGEIVEKSFSIFTHFSSIHTTTHIQCKICWARAVSMANSNTFACKSTNTQTTARYSVIFIWSFIFHFFLDVCVYVFVENCLHFRLHFPLF